MVDQHEIPSQKDPLDKIIERLTQTPGAINELQNLKRATTEQWRAEGFGEEVRLFVDGDGQPILVSRRNGTLQHEESPEDHEYRLAFDGRTVDIAIPAPLAGEYEMTRSSGGGIGIYDFDSNLPLEDIAQLAEKFGSYLYINIPPMKLDTDKGITPQSLLGDGGNMLKAYDIDGIQQEAIRTGLLDAQTLSAALGRRVFERDEHFL